MSASHALNAPIEKAPAISLWVWFTGSTALLEGQGLCYDYDSGTASSFDAKRVNRVELPSQTNNRWFAGVSSRAYGASSGGQFIEIYAPGSTCNILSKVSNTLGTGRTTCIAGGTYAGYFERAGFEGRGSAVALQTVDRSSTAGKCMARLEDGFESGLVEVVTAEAGANTFMVGGVTYIVGADIASDATFTLADGTLPGQKKAFCVVDTAVTTSDVVVTVTSGVQGSTIDLSSTALASLTLNADNEVAVLQWDCILTNGLWRLVHIVGATPA